MYDAFDSFIRVGTWQTRQPSDEERFHLALGKVVWSDDFDPDQMANYLREKLNLPPEDRGSYFAQTIDRYCDDAWAVKNFLSYNNIRRSSSVITPSQKLPQLRYVKRNPSCLIGLQCVRRPTRRPGSKMAR